MKKLTWRLFGLLLLAGLATTPALADFNVGASVTDTRIEEDDFDADDNNWKIFGGWRFLKFFGVEAQYVDFGDFSERISGSQFDAEASSVDVFAVGSIQFWRVDLFGKAGYSFWDVETNLGDDDGTDFAWGVGGAFRITKRIWVRGEYELYEFDTADTEMASLGVDIRFW